MQRFDRHQAVIAGAHQAVQLRDAAHERHGQGDRVVADVLHPVVGDVADRDPPGCGGLDVHGVHAHPVAADGPQPRQRVHHRGGERGVLDQDPVGAVRGLDDLLLVGGLRPGELDAASCGDRLLLVEALVVAVDDGDPRVGARVRGGDRHPGLLCLCGDGTDCAVGVGAERAGTPSVSVS